MSPPQSPEDDWILQKNDKSKIYTSTRMLLEHQV